MPEPAFLDTRGASRGMLLVAIVVAAFAATSMASALEGRAGVTDKPARAKDESPDAAPASQSRADQVVFSDIALAELKSHEELDRRLLAFDRMLAFDSGWWGDHVTLRDFAHALALSEVRKTFGRGAEDDVDWERIGEQLLVELFQRADTIEGSARAWLVSVAHDLVVRADHPPGAIELSNDDLKTIRALPEPLRKFAELSLVQGLTKSAICRRLSLTEETFRQRRSAMQEALAKP